MFKHILVPVDGSPTSMLAVSKAADLAKAFGSQVTALYVIDPYPFTGVGADFAYAVDTVLGEGHAVHEGIVRALENTGADLIVMGSHGRRGLERLMLGSVTQRVLGVAHVPVLVVRS